MRTAHDVWADPELRELVRDEPELAAIADALAHADAATAPRRGHLPRRIATAGVAVAAAVALALVAPWEHSGGSTSSLALAALGNGPVLHAVVRADESSGSVLVELSTGRTRRHTYATEYWYDAGRRLLAIHTIRDGHVVRVTLNTPTGGSTDGMHSAPGGYRLAPDPALTGFLTRYRKALADGRAHVTGHTTVAGRRAVLLEIARPGGWVDQVALDAKSYRPLRYRTVNPAQPKYEPRWQSIAVIETIPRRAGQFVTPAFVPNPAGGRARDAGTVTLGEAGRVLGKPALWPGQIVSGLPLAEATRQELETRFPRREHRPPLVGPGLQLRYGGPVSYVGSGQAFVQIQEAARPHGAYRFQGPPMWPLTFGGAPVPPPGWIDLSRLSPGHWFAQLRQDGLFLLVTASSRDLLLQALRQLRPLR